MLSFHCVLSATYVALSWAISMCYWWHISLNFTSLLSIVAMISTQLCMMSPGEKEALNAVTFNMMTGHFVEFVQSFYSKADHVTVNLGTNTIKYVSEMGLYVILSTLETFGHLNQSFNHEISAGETVSGMQVHSHPYSSYKAFWTQNKYYFNYLTQQLGHATPKRTEQWHKVTPKRN